MEIVVTDTDIDGLVALTRQYPQHLRGLRMKNILVSENGEKGYLTEDYPRLYNKKYYSFHFPIHKQLLPIDNSQSDSATGSFLIPMEAIMSLAKVYAAIDRYQDAISLLEKYAPQCKTARYTFTHANILLQNEQFLKALVLYLQTVTMKEADTLGENLMFCYGKIIKIYNAMGETDTAKMFHEKYEALKAEADRVINS